MRIYGFSFLMNCSIHKIFMCWVTVHNIDNIDVNWLMHLHPTYKFLRDFGFNQRIYILKTTAIDLNLEFTQAYFQRGKTQLFQGFLEKAIADFHQVIQLLPRIFIPIKIQRFSVILWEILRERLKI